MGYPVGITLLASYAVAVLTFLGEEVWAGSVDCMAEAVW